MTVTRPRILCVDDDPVILSFLERILVSKDYEVIKAENGEGALRKIENEWIDLVISDVVMPKMDGLEACRRIKGDERYRHIPVILITGRTEKEARVRGIEAGAEDFISKPIDHAEVIARVKMLLKAKAQQERTMGKLLIDMGFITEHQLEEALILAKEQNIKVGDALYSMGALDKDHIYWVLSNQLNMNYIELSPEMIDKEIIAQFSIDLLEQLQCLPFYENAEEIHFAIADPTNHQVVKEVKSLKPEKAVQLHLALPEKIMNILSFFKKEFHSLSQAQKIIHAGKKVLHASAQVVESPDHSKSKYLWSDLVDLLFSMSQGDSYWFYKTPDACRLLSQKREGFETLPEYPEQSYIFVKEWVKQSTSSQDLRGGARLYIENKSSKEKGAFRVWQISCFDKDMIKIERIPTFSMEEFMRSQPQTPRLIEELQHLFHEHHRLIIGGNEKLFIKQCCYSIMKRTDVLSVFPPVFFIEGEMEMYFPEVAQLNKYQFNSIKFLELFNAEQFPCIFYETHFPEIDSGEKYLIKYLSNLYKNIILYPPFFSPEAMKRAVSMHPELDQAGFKSVFFSQYQFESI